MKKSDLKTGMRVKLRDGEIHLVVKDIESEIYGHQEIAFICENSFMPGSKYHEGLTHERYEESDIVEVFMIGGSDSLLDGRFLDLDVRRSIWKRKEQRYYLKDKFYDNDFYGSFLNYETNKKVFNIGDENQDYGIQTQFTDQDIIDLKIPTERFTKIPVE